MQNKKKTSCWFSCNNNLLPAVAFFYFSLSWWIRKKNKIKAGSIARPFSTHLHLFPGSELASRWRVLPSWFFDHICPWAEFIRVIFQRQIVVNRVFNHMGKEKEFKTKEWWTVNIGGFIYRPWTWLIPPAMAYSIFIDPFCYSNPATVK